MRQLSTEMPKFALEAWIRPLAVFEGDHKLRLVAPSPFHRERVRSRFLERIERCATRAAGSAVDVTLVLAGGDTGAGGEEVRKPAERAQAVPRPDPRPSPADKVCPATRPVLLASRLAPRPDQPAPVRQQQPEVSDSAQPEVSDSARQRELPHTFETFVVGPANALAREASLAVAQGRQLGVSPLFLAGTAGTGKSHLARAAVREAHRHGRRPRYTSAEAFTSQLMSSIRNHETGGFKRRFRTQCDLLVLEDVQFLEGKAATQLELFHTVEHLRLVGKRVLLTGDRLPRDMARLDGRLASQITSGLVAEIELPDRALRRAILRDKASRGGVRIPEDCLDYLVDSVRGNVRDLEGVLIQLVTSASLLGQRVDRALAEAALRKIVSMEERAALGIDEVVGCVVTFFGVARHQLASRSRRRDVLVPRQLAMYLCRRYTDASLSEIGRALGRDHPAVANAIRVVERGILERAPLRYQVEELAARLERERRHG